MSRSECPITFACDGESLFGIVSLPARPNGMGVVVVVGGPQYRVGSHRQFVLLARRLAADGYTVLRFDLRGMGDSTGPLTTFESSTADLSAALGAFESAYPQPLGYALWGLCDGASALLLYLDSSADPRVKAICLVNPWVRAAESLARTHLKHYYFQRLLQREFWAKFLRGQIGLGAARELGQKLHRSLAGGAASYDGKKQHYVARMACACLRFGGPVLVALSEDDFTAREFEEVSGSSEAWQRALSRSNVARAEVAGADHTFSDHLARRRLEDLTLKLLGRARQLAS